MKGISHRVTKSFLIILSVLFLYPSLSLAGQFKITRVYDGDTVKAIGHDITIKIRLVGIDAPETSHGKRKPGQPFGQRSKKYLADLVLNQIVDVSGFGLGPYNRILGVITLDGRNINLEMIMSGLAEVYRGLAPKKFNLDPYWQGEREARQAKRGMWVLGDKYMSPKEWRIHKGE
jgi:endonuclease YncB( thermonuclease family)